MPERDMTVREVVSDDGTRIVYRVGGPTDGRPVLLVHGWAQSSACWGMDVLGALARGCRVIALDLRGHGYSGAPERGYDDPANWAADLRAVLAAEAPGGDAVLVGWSYGGLVCCDYLQADGSASAGLVLVGAITGIGRGSPGGRVGKAMSAAMPDALSADPGRAVPALTRFTHALQGQADGKGDREQAMLGAALATPPHVRTALFSRQDDHEELLRTLSIPVLIMHGTSDDVVHPETGRHAAASIPHARTSWWKGGGHAPFLEDADRFVEEVTGFVDSVESGAGAER